MNRPISEFAFANTVDLSRCKVARDVHKRHATIRYVHYVPFSEELEQTKLIYVTNTTSYIWPRAFPLNCLVLADKINGTLLLLLKILIRPYFTSRLKDSTEME